MLHLGEVEIGTGSTRDEFLRIVEEVERKVKDGGRDGRVVDEDAGLVKVPSSWAVNGA